jgi:hypothetical protein
MEKQEPVSRLRGFMPFVQARNSLEGDGQKSVVSLRSLR